MNSKPPEHKRLLGVAKAIGLVPLIIIGTPLALIAGNFKEFKSYCTHYLNDTKAYFDEPPSPLPKTPPPTYSPQNLEDFQESKETPEEPPEVLEEDPIDLLQKETEERALGIDVKEDLEEPPNMPEENIKAPEEPIPPPEETIDTSIEEELAPPLEDPPEEPIDLLQKAAEERDLEIDVKKDLEESPNISEENKEEPTPPLEEPPGKPEKDDR